MDMKRIGKVSHIGWMDNLLGDVIIPNMNDSLIECMAKKTWY